MTPTHTAPYYDRTVFAEGDRKNRSGQAYLYRRAGNQSNVLDFRLRDEIDGLLLQQALNTALGCYPYLSSRLIERDGDFYFAANPYPCTVTRTGQLRPLAGETVHDHLIDVTWSGRSLCVAFDHALCDGGGLLPFVRTLLCRYFALRYDQESNIPGVRLTAPDAAQLSAETAEPMHARFPVDESRLTAPWRGKALRLPESRKPDGLQQTYYRYEMRISRASYLALSRRLETSPGVLTALLMSRAVAALHGTDEPIAAHTAANIRRVLGFPDTFRNCTRSIPLLYDAGLHALPLPEQAAAFRQTLREQCTPDNTRAAANAIVGMSDHLDTLPSLAAKKAAMTFFDDIQMDTYVLSYLGQLNLGPLDEYLEELYFYNAGTTGLVLNLADVAGTFCLCFMQSFPDDCYVNAFSTQLAQHGLAGVCSSCIPFTTPRSQMQEPHT